MQVVGVEPVGIMTEGRRYKVILFDYKNREIMINKRLVSAGLATFLDEEKHFLDEPIDVKLGGDSARDSSSISDRIDEPQERISAQDLRLTTVVQHRNECEVLLPEDFNLNDRIAADEKNKMIDQLLRDVESGRFEYSAFYNNEVSRPIICSPYYKI